jgi:selenocysteine-specific elongation factor
MRSTIVGTAGHIDHGKTSLVRALTGVDADRLPEEKRRGITIDLGFAELDLGEVRVGFVDVPGHERFVKNMLAGAHGIDLVVLVVAADEGVMPQTREHFDICRLLGVQGGMVALTKADAVESDLIELVAAEVAELVTGSFLEGAPVVAVSSVTGLGLEEFKKTLHEISLKVPPRASDSVARLPVDRAFTMRGFGTVITGTLVAGEIAEGEEMELLPSGGRVRVRGIQVHGKSVHGARAGQRTAVNLGGIDVGAIERGMVLAPAGRLLPTQIVDARVEVLKNAPRALRSRQRVRVHLGTAEILARVAVLEESGEITAGASGLVQLRLETPVVALPGERFIVRSYSPQHTVAGGEVLDAHAIKHRGRDRHISRERLVEIARSSPAARVAYFVATSGEKGLRRTELAARTGWRDEVLDGALEGARTSGSIRDAEGVFISSDAFDELLRLTLEEVAAFLAREPLARGLPRETLRERIFSRAAPEVFRAVVQDGEDRGDLVTEREIVRLSGHRVDLSPADAMVRDRLEDIYRDAGLEAPTLEEALERVGSSAQARDRARKILRLSVEAGTLVRVKEEMLFHQRAVARLVDALREYGDRHEPERLIDVAGFKEISGVSRKYAIPLLEYFDREKITRRAGDKRIILKA